MALIRHIRAGQLKLMSYLLIALYFNYFTALLTSQNKFKQLQRDKSEQFHIKIKQMSLFKKFFQKTEGERSETTKIDIDCPDIIFPEERFTAAEINDGEHPGTALINTSLAGFPCKKAFGFECSIVMEPKDTYNNGLPTPRESEILYEQEDLLNNKFKGDSNQPQALFVGHLLINRTMTSIWRINNPDRIIGIVKECSSEKKFKRPFRIDFTEDPMWEQTSVIYEGIGMKL